ncbi:MAG: hypothetical protein IPJ34_30040 [Myxococcales bacterium]|nr:hypothetical protein [Myxococcales bacterium]
MTMFRNLTPYTEAHLVATSTTEQYAWFTDWMSTAGIDNLRSVLKCKNATGAYFQWRLAIQYAAVRSDEPDAPSTLGSAQTSSGEYQTGDISVATSMGTKQLFRLGIAYTTAPNGSGVQQGDVGLQASWKQVGTDLGPASVAVSVVDTGTKYEVLTPWLPATIMSKVAAAFTMTSITGASANLRYRLAYQTAGTRVQQPNAWQNLEADWTTPQNAYNERHTGMLDLTTTDMWFRLGVAYSLTSGVDNNVTAQLDANCSCR